MSVADNYTPVRQLGNGSTVDYSRNWQIIAPPFLKVELHAVADGAITPQTLGSDYTLVYSSAGFTVTFNTAPTSSYYVVIYRGVTINQQAPIRTSQGFQGDVIELAFDKLTVISQDLKNDSDRSLKFPIGSGVSDITLPDPVANATLAFNGTADALITGATLGEIAAAAQNAQAAEDAKDDSEAALAAFQNEYLGVAASDPTQTPAGNPLAEGMLYWNSTIKALRIYNGSAWESYPLPPDGSITLPKLAPIPANTILINPTGSSATPQAADQFAAMPIGVPFGVLDHLTGAPVPLNTGDAKFIKLTAGLTDPTEYNEGLLTNESVSGTAPLVVATAEIAYAPSPIDGQVIRLWNTENRYPMPGESAGTASDDQMQQITGGIGNGTAGAFIGVSTTLDTGALSKLIRNTGIVPSGGSFVSSDINFDSANSPDARTGDHTNVKHEEVTYYVRIA